jgi:hypothetical protein
LAIKKPAAKSENDGSYCKDTQMTNVQENILRYAAEYVPFTLRRQCLNENMRVNGSKGQNASVL